MKRSGRWLTICSCFVIGVLFTAAISKGDWLSVSGLLVLFVVQIARGTREEVLQSKIDNMKDWRR